MINTINIEGNSIVILNLKDNSQTIEVHKHSNGDEIFVRLTGLGIHKALTVMPISTNLIKIRIVDI